MRWDPNKKPPAGNRLLLREGWIHCFPILFSYWFSNTTINNSIVSNQKKKEVPHQSYFLIWGSLSNTKKGLLGIWMDTLMINGIWMGNKIQWSTSGCWRHCFFFQTPRPSRCLSTWSGVKSSFSCQIWKRICEAFADYCCQVNFNWPNCVLYILYIYVCVSHSSHFHDDSGNCHVISCPHIQS